MKSDKLKEAQLYFERQISAITINRELLHDIRKSFVSYYTPSRIRNMPLEHYALGNELPDKGFNFCHTLEYKLGGLGITRGSSAYKFGVYYGKTVSDPEYRYRFTDKFGTNPKEAFENIKSAILELIAAGHNRDINSIVNSPISHMFKGKILSTYFPDQYLNVFSDDHLMFYLTQLNLDTEGVLDLDPVLKRDLLLKFKNQDPVMKVWSVDIFSYFLYTVYPGRPPKDDKLPPNDPLKDFRLPKFPINPIPSFIDQEMTMGTGSSPSKSKNKTGSENPDYEGDQKARKLLGQRGEQLVLQLEKERLRHLPNLVKNVAKAKYDYEGYDILSFEESGSERHIEVKATTAKSGQANFFLSSNELDKAGELENYWVYMVYDILSQNPKIWRIPNPFSPENAAVKKIPISFRVTINVKKP